MAGQYSRAIRQFFSKKEGKKEENIGSVSLGFLLIQRGNQK